MRGWLSLGILSTILAVVLAAPVRADKADEPVEHGGSGQTAKHDKPAEHGDDVFKGALDLGIWTVVVFLGLLFVLTKFAWKPMLQGLEKREHEIHAAVEESRKAREDAEKLHKQLEAERLKGAEQVRAMLDDARKAADELAARRKVEADAAIQADRERLQRELAVARDQALKEMWDQLAQLATVVSSKAIRRQLTPEDHRALVDEALTEMKQAAADRQRALAGV